MSQVIDLEEGRLLRATRRGYRNWISRFKENFGIETKLSQISLGTLSYIAQGEEKGTFYLYDLILNIRGMGSGFDFDGLGPKEKMEVIDQYIFLLDRIRFECMKRLGWLESYPGEDFTLVELITRFNILSPGLQARVPRLSRSFPGYEMYSALNTFDRETFIRKLIPKVIREMKNYSTTL